MSPGHEERRPGGSGATSSRPYDESEPMVSRIEAAIAADVGMSVPEWRRWVDEVGSVLSTTSTPTVSAVLVVRCDYCGRFLPTRTAVLRWTVDGETSDGHTVARVAAYHPAGCAEFGR